jgi:hypothetical protein
MKVNPIDRHWSGDIRTIIISHERTGLFKNRPNGHCRVEDHYNTGLCRDRSPFKGIFLSAITYITNFLSTKDCPIPHFLIF